MTSTETRPAARVVSTLTCASFPVQRRHLREGGYVVPGLECCCRRWRCCVVLMQGCSHLGGRSLMCGGGLGRTQGPILATSWSRRVRSRRVDGSSRTARWCRDQTVMLLLKLRRGNLIWVLRVEGPRRSVGRLLLTVLGTWRRRCWGRDGGIWLRRRSSTIWRRCYMMLRVALLVVVGAVCDRRFAGSRNDVTGNTGVVLMLRRSSVVAGRRIHGWIGLQRTWREGESKNWSILSLL